MTSEFSRREVLNWERELIGLYVSDHPLSPVMDVLTQAVTHFSGQLSEVSPTERVRVAGLITRIRTHQTKTGKSMGFVTLEDLQGTVELVIFPRTWEKASQIIEFDQIILAEGRVDVESAEPKVLVDSISTDLKVTVPLSGASFPPPTDMNAGANHSGGNRINASTNKQNGTKGFEPAEPAVVRKDRNPLSRDTLIVIAEGSQSARASRIGDNMDKLRAVSKRPDHLRFNKTGPRIARLRPEDPVEFDRMACGLVNLKGELRAVQDQGGHFGRAGLGLQ